MKITHKSLVFLTVVNLIGNLLFFIAIALLITLPNIFKNNIAILYSILLIVLIIYYIVFLSFVAHYAPIVRDYAKTNKDLVYSFIWFSAYIIGFVIFYRFINRVVALEIFGSGATLYLLQKAITSFGYWKKKRKKKSRKGR